MRDTPLIIAIARAGEESRVEGMDAGAVHKSNLSFAFPEPKPSRSLYEQRRIVGGFDPDKQVNGRRQDAHVPLSIVRTGSASEHGATDVGMRFEGIRK